MKKLIILLIPIVIIPCLCLYIIQRTVCSELQDIMHYPGSYNIFIGCVIQVETAPMDFNGEEDGKGNAKSGNTK